MPKLGSSLRAALRHQGGVVEILGLTVIEQVALRLQIVLVGFGFIGAMIFQSGFFFRAQLQAQGFDGSLEQRFVPREGVGGGNGERAAANRSAGLGIEQRVIDLDEIVGLGIEGDGEAEVGAEHVGGIGEGGDFLFLQAAWRHDFEGAILGKLAELGGHAFDQSLAEGREFGVGVAAG